jgi:hypothetical protein
VGPRNPQRLAEERSIALHREVADRLLADPSLVQAARARVLRWARAGALAPFYAAAWTELLGRPLGELCEALADPGQRGRALRQCSPFAGALDPRTRWCIHRAVGARSKR